MNPSTRNALAIAALVALAATSAFAWSPNDAQPAASTAVSTGAAMNSTVFDEARDPDAFLRRAALGGQVRIAIRPTGGEQPQALGEFPTLGLFAPEEAFEVTERFAQTRNSLREKLRRYRIAMDRNDLADSLREARLVERYETFEALLRSLNEDTYLTAPAGRQIDLNIAGYRVYNTTARQAGRTVRLIIPIRFATYPALDLAVRNLRNLQGEQQDRCIASFNRLAAPRRERILGIWHKHRIQRQKLSAAESKCLEPYLEIEHRFDLATRTLRPRGS